MSEVATGVIKEIKSKPWKDKFLYTIVLNGDNNYYGTGFTKPKAIAGDYVTFEWGTNDKGYKDADPKSLVVNKIKALADQQVGTVAKSASFSKDDYWNVKSERDIETQKRIELQASRNSALEMVSLLLKAGAVKLPAAASKQEEVISQMVSHYQEKFLKETRGQEQEVEKEVEIAASEPASTDNDNNNKVWD